MSTQRIFTSKDLGRAIKAARTRHGLNQIELAQHANVSRGVVQKLEEGRGTVALDNALKLLHILSLDLVVQSRSAHGQNPPSNG
jgi:ribosome-binding protein aMBF1 (putative translation factor)